MIGQSSNIFLRWYNHKNKLERNVHPNSHLQNSWNKYGEQNFKFEIILECPEEKLNKEETRLIKEYKSNDRKFGYNLTDGGEGKRGWKCSEETKRKISKANKGRKMSSEAIRKMIEYRTGRKLSEETKRKMSKSQNGRKHSEETKIKMSKSQKGRKVSILARTNMSKAGKLAWVKRKKHIFRNY